MIKNCYWHTQGVVKVKLNKTKFPDFQTTGSVVNTMQLATHQKEREATFALWFLLPQEFLWPLKRHFRREEEYIETLIQSEVALPMNTCKLNLLCFVNHLFCLYWIFRGKCDNPTVRQMFSRVFHLIKPLQWNGLKQHGAFLIWDLRKNFNIQAL